MREFRVRRSVNVPYNRQGAIWFTMKRYHSLPDQKKKRVNELLRAAAGENWEALLDYFTSDDGNKVVLKKHHIASLTTISRAMKKFMEAFPDDLL